MKCNGLGAIIQIGIDVGTVRDGKKWQMRNAFCILVCVGLEDHEMKVILAGGTGFIGQRVVDRLMHDKQKCVLVTRHPERVKNFYSGLLRVERWIENTPALPKELVDEGDVIINLAGESLASGRWSAERKKILLHSRIDSTKAIIRMIEKAGKKPAALINASAVGYYGHVPDADVVEGNARGSDFLATLVGQWEATALEAAAFGVRVVLLRTGVVLDTPGGALPRFVKPFRLYAGGWFGSGNQWFPWIHREDVVEIISFLVKNTFMIGPVNVVAPEQVTMKEFCTVLSAILKRPCWLPVPDPLLRVMLGEMADMLLTGQKVIPKVLLDSGYRFKYPSLEDSLRAILTKRT